VFYARQKQTLKQVQDNKLVVFLPLLIDLLYTQYPCGERAPAVAIAPEAKRLRRRDKPLKSHCEEHGDEAIPTLIFRCVPAPKTGLQPQRSSLRETKGPGPV